MGQEFASAYPAIAPMLAERGGDPDVERLLEGVAFLTGRIRQKLDDEFPEITHGLMNLLWPHYLRPIPSFSLIEFTPTRLLGEKQLIPRGTEVASIPIDGTACRFRTCYDVTLSPLAIEEVAIQTLPSGQSALRVSFKVSPGGTGGTHGPLRFHLHGEQSALILYLWINRYLSEVQVRRQGQPNSPIRINPRQVTPVGFSKEEALIPYPRTAFDGYRLLQEYFIFPEKFLFFDLPEFHTTEPFEIYFIFSKIVPASVRVSKDNLRLHCTPVVNLISMESEPIRVTHERLEYLIRPEGKSGNTHYEVYSVDGAQGWIRGTSEKQPYLPFYSFTMGAGQEGENYYQTRLQKAVVGERVDTWVSFVNRAQKSVIPPTETIVFDLTCTNRDLTRQLRVGDIKAPTAHSPEFAQFKNFTRITLPIRPFEQDDLYWRLLSHLSLNFLSLSDAEAFRGILKLYTFQSLSESGLANARRMDGIIEIKNAQKERLFHGIPVRGILTTMGVKEEAFINEGDIFLFGTILNEFIALYAALNSFSELQIKGVTKGETYQWPARIGCQQIL